MYICSTYVHYYFIASYTGWHFTYRMMGKLFHECKDHIKEDHLLLRLLVFLCSEDDIDVMLNNAPVHIVALHVSDLWRTINKVNQVPNLYVA